MQLAQKPAFDGTVIQLKDASGATRLTVIPDGVGASQHHNISKEDHKADDGNMSTITPVCACGWRGFGVAAYNDDQYSLVRQQGEAHLRDVAQAVGASAT